MDRLISEAAVIDLLKQMRKDGDMVPWEGKDVFARIRKLPSAQLAQDTNVLSKELVSKQAVINEVSRWRGHLDDDMINRIQIGMKRLPSAQPETAKRIVGKSRGGMTLWYQCDMCNEPVDAQDNFCCGCGRRLIDG